MLSLILNPSIDYPTSGDFYSPDERFPEYRFEHISSRPNPVYRAVRDCFLQAGLDSEHADMPSWNPLGKLIPSGSRVFVLCNFAHDRGKNELTENFYSRCTHGSVIRAAIDYILLAVGEKGIVRFGNASTQVCHWNKVLYDTGADEVWKFYQNNAEPVEACDLRLFVKDSSSYGAIRSVEWRDESLGLHIDLGADSMYSVFDSKGAQRYRVMDYPPNRTEEYHSGGRHEYVISRKILESDVIFSIPKLKTHEKVGISCALKGFVGIVGHKDSLPHHRYGSPEMGGDEYPSDRFGFLRSLSAIHEWAQKIQPESTFGSSARVAYRVAKRLVRIGSPTFEGAWWGNDTAWRMVLDLARIATYASENGDMLARPVRRHLAMIDGIYGGEGEGPSYSTAVRSGLLLFSDHILAVDTLCALAMGFVPERIPMLRQAMCLTKWPLNADNLEDETVIVNSQPRSFQDFRENPPYRFEPPDGWKGHI